MASIDESVVKKALSKVQDPDLGQDLVSLGMIKNLQIEGNNVSFSIELTTAACPVKDQMKNQAVHVVKEAGADNVNVTMTSQPKTFVQEAISLPGVKKIIAVGSGKGGVGKSTTCVNIARAFSQKGYKVGIMDGDIYGPNIPNILGLGQPKLQVGSDQKILPVDCDGMKIMSFGFLVQANQPVIWRGPMLNKTVREFLGGVNWGELDYLFIDLPPGTGDVQLSLTQSVNLHGAIMVTTPQQLSVVDTRKGIGMFRKVQVDILGIIQNMSYFEAPDTGKQYHIFDSDGGVDLANELNIKFLGDLPLESSVAKADGSGLAGERYQEIMTAIEASLKEVEALKMSFVK